VVSAISGQTPPPKGPPVPTTTKSGTNATPAPLPGLFTTPAPASIDPTKVVLTIGDEKFTAVQYQQMVSGLPPQFQTAAMGPGKRQFLEQLIRVKLLAKEAERRKLDQKPSVQQQMEFQRTNLLAQALYQDLMDTAKVDDTESRKYFDEHKNEFEQVKARHILIRFKGSPVQLEPGKKDLTEEEALAKAQEIRKKLLAGEDFAMLAKAESDDKGSGANGGDLGPFKRGQMVPAFEQAAFALPPGQLSEPVKSTFGYHLIRVDQKDTKTFDEVKGDIEKKLRPEIARKQVEDIRKNAPVTIDDTFFGPAGPAAQ
jgi:peptidyl-prolyl cis-trans isomerase C